LGKMRPGEGKLCLSSGPLRTCGARARRGAP
jgi:hypothetical protein